MRQSKTTRRPQHARPRDFRIEPVERRRLLATFIVTNTLDADPGSLRDALNNANLTPGEDTIQFAIGTGAQTITPLAPLPVVDDPLIIDGSTQPGFTGSPLITIDGINVFSSGLRVSAGDSTVRALRITRFGSNALLLDTDGGNDIVGNHLVGNAAHGIQVESPDNDIGGTTAAQRNIISGNGADGVRVSSLVSGTSIRGNWIGLNAAGAAQGNNGSGVTVFGSNNAIGGDVAGAGNVISANRAHGVHLSGAAATGNTLQGNFIGTDATGSIAIGNGQPGDSGMFGVRVNAAGSNTIGGTTAGARNVISGNHFDGIRIEGLGANGNLVKGNYIGTNAAGTAALPNANDGIQITSGTHTIGGAEAGAGNLISGNADDGIEIQSTSTGNNIVQGNFFGTNAAGTGALGNGSDGVEIQGSSNNVIGGTGAAERNVIAASSSDGIEILADSSGLASGNQIRGNLIGVGAGGQSLGNTRNGINLENALTTSVSGNTIANNLLDGVFVNTAATANSIRQNSIRSNGGLGIDLGVDGVTPNDPFDADSGANELQNFPTLSAASPGGSVQVSLNSAPNAQFTIDIYVSTVADASGFGEGETHVASTVVTTDAAGNAAASVSVPGLALGQVVSATATNAAGSTSEFSAAIPVGNDTIAPTVIASSFLFDGATLPAAPHRLTFTFSENVSASLGANDLLLENLTTGATVPTGSIDVSYNAGTNTATFTFPGFTNGVLPDGRYRATLLAAGITDPAGNPLPANHVFNFFVLAGDANHDGTVNLSDFNVLASNFGQSPRIFSQGDFNYDGVVNLADFNILATRFGTSIAPTASFGSNAIDAGEASGDDESSELG